MIEGRPRESLVLYEAPFEVSFVSDLFQNSNLRRILMKIYLSLKGRKGHQY